MAVSSRCSLDTACTSITYPDLMLRKWAFLVELDSPLLQILPRSHGFPLRAIGVELLSAEGVVVAEADPGLQMLRSGGDIRAESNILFPP